MKIKCVKTINGSMVPIHQIVLVSAPNCSHYIWTSAGLDYFDGRNELSDEQYNKLLNELEIL